MQKNPILFEKEVKKNWMAIGIAYHIIIKEISSEIAFNIIDLEDLKDIWTKLKNIYNKVGQGVIYLIF